MFFTSWAGVHRGTAPTALPPLLLGEGRGEGFYVGGCPNGTPHEALAQS